MGAWKKTRSLKHSCSDNNISGLIPLFFKMVASMFTTQRLVHTVYGKQVYLIKMTDKLTTRVNGLSETLRTVDKTFHAWQSEFQAFAKTEQCHHDASLEFLSKYTMEVNRALTSLLRFKNWTILSGKLRKLLTTSWLVSTIFPALFQRNYQLNSPLSRL